MATHTTSSSPPEPLQGQYTANTSLVRRDTAAANQGQKRKRVRTGCITCRVRRVKCDETKPHCTKCTSTGRKCDGYDAPSVSRNELARAIKRGEPLTTLQYGSSTFVSDDERQTFEFFRRKTAVAGEANILDWGFWDQIVLQFVHTDSAIKHGVLALSNLHRNFNRGHHEYSPSEPEYFNDPKTIAWYSKALAEMPTLFASVDTDAAAVQKVIAASIIFLCIENLLGDGKSARMHLQNALRIENEDQAKRANKSKINSRESVVTQALNRIDFGSMTLSSNEAPYPWKDDGSDASHSVRVPTTFTSLHQAEMWLFALLRDMFSFGRSLLGVGSAFDMLGKITRAATWYVQQMTNWKLAFEPLATHLERLDETTKNRCLILRAYHRLGFMLGSAGYMPTELSWDACDDQFTEMLDWIEELPAMAQRTTVFSLEPGVLCPLFLAATRCRHPQIRRRAIALMQKQRRKEMVWESNGAAVVAEWILNLEENGKRPKTDDGRPHEQDRFRVIDVDINPRINTLKVKAFLCSQDNSNKLRAVTETLRICRGTGPQEECICGEEHHSTSSGAATRTETEFERKSFDNERLGNARGWVPLGRSNFTPGGGSSDDHALIGSLIGVGIFEVNEEPDTSGSFGQNVTTDPVPAEPADGLLLAPSPAELESSAIDMSVMWERAWRTGGKRTDNGLPNEEVARILHFQARAQEAVGTAHIELMKWSSEKYAHEKSKLRY